MHTLKCGGNVPPAVGHHDIIVAPTGGCNTVDVYLEDLSCHGFTCKVGLGLAYLSGTDDILAGVSARKQIILGSGVSPVTLKLKVQADVNTQASQVRAALRGQHVRQEHSFDSSESVEPILSSA